VLIAGTGQDVEPAYRFGDQSHVDAAFAGAFAELPVDDI
jgi:hypothetical protein